MLAVYTYTSDVALGSDSSLSVGQKAGAEGAVQVHTFSFQWRSAVEVGGYPRHYTDSAVMTASKLWGLRWWSPVVHS